MQSLLLAAQTAQNDDAGGFIAFLVLLGFLYAIYKAMTKKSVYDIQSTTRGTIRKR
ncbi:hypothetical protein [Crateriforma conspicua]|uniref:hypothetical protein n=1 Tax=Crateriforma conspicua TaxID=2527996 RepID=UPI001188BAF3|nr:hypothetical protein [Crateriforma conspicua]QDV61987.1 hypothetical protein Mal65_11150 [Crateriforma conspicua]